MSIHSAQSISIKIQPDILSQDLDGEIVLLNMKNEHYYSLKESGVFMWQLLNRHSNKQMVKELLLQEYEIDEATIQRDLDSFIDWLVEKNLATVSTNSDVEAG